MNNYYGGNWAPDARPSEVLPVNVINSYLTRVFSIMGLGLAITGTMAWLFFSMAFSAEAVDGYQIASDLYLRQEYAFLFTGIMRWVIMLAPLAFILVLSFGINSFSYSVSTLIFVAFAAVMGISLSAIFAIYTIGSIAATFFIAAGMFGGLALYGATTKKDLSSLGSIAFMGLLGIILATVVNWFLQSDTMGFIISIVGVLVFCALTAYDMQKILREGLTMDADSEVAKKASIMGALTLYLDFINLFLYLLRLLGSRRD